MEKACSQCNRIFGDQNSIEDARKGILGFKLKSDQSNTSQAESCLLCSTLSRRWSQSLPIDHTFTVQLEGLDSDVPKLHIIAEWTRTSYPTISYLVYAAKADPAASFITVRPVNLDVASSASFEQAKTWIATCDREHPECNKWMSNTMPLRVLDLSHSSDDYVSLCETQGQSLRFAALSYCWGTAGFLTTRLANLSQHMQRIQLSMLPLTIQDAITCTKRLGLRYVWIDALCIVQDDDVEKYKEISRMKDFYRSAYVTISAANAGNCHHGFLQKRQSYEPNLEINVICPDGRKGHLQLVELHKQPHPRFVLCPGAEPISYRAWTMQESLLSSRILIYARVQVFWLCRQSFASDGGNMTWSDFSNHAAWLQLDLDDAVSNCKEETDIQFADEFDRYHLKWTTLISVYSGRDLSYRHDKLPALSAIASLFQERMQDEYICGLWRKSILFDMTWAPARHWIERPSSSGVYAGPSWSWISYPGLVRYVGNWKQEREIAKVVSVTATPCYSFAPLGQVTTAEIVVEAPFFSLQLHPGLSSDWLLHATSNVFGVCTLAAAFRPDHSGEVQARIVAAEKLYCAVFHGTEARDERQQGDVTGLVLVKTNDGAFSRIERFQVYAHSMGNEQMLSHDGCSCLERDPESRRRRDVEVIRNLMLMPRNVVTIR